LDSYDAHLNPLEAEDGVQEKIHHEEVMEKMRRAWHKPTPMLENYILQSNGTHKILQKQKHRKHIKQERHIYVVHPIWATSMEKQIVLPFILSSKMKRYNLHQIRCSFPFALT